MCTPPAMFALSAFSKVVAYGEQVKATNAENSRRSLMRISAAKSRDNQTRATNLKIQQEIENKTQEKFDNDIAFMEKTATAYLGAGARGVAGRVLQNAWMQSESDRLKGQQVINTESSRLVAQGTIDRAGLDAQLESRINNLQPKAKPSFLPVATSVAMDYGDMRMDMEEIKLQKAQNSPENLAG